MDVIINFYIPLLLPYFSYMYCICKSGSFIMFTLPEHFFSQETLSGFIAASCFIQPLFNIVFGVITLQVVEVLFGGPSYWNVIKFSLSLCLPFFNTLSSDPVIYMVKYILKIIIQLFIPF